MYIKGNSPLHRLIILFLNAVSLIFKTISFLNLKRKARKQKHYPEAAIISIDNLSFGGTGKTTLVIETGQFLEQRNIKFAIVTRGYKSAYESQGAVILPDYSPRTAGDEAALFKHHFPQQDIYIGKNRTVSIEKAIANHNKIILLDDGFQTTNIAKDVKIMLINPRHPYYYLRNFKGLMKEEDYVLFYQSAPSYLPESTGKPVYGTYTFEAAGFYDKEGSPVTINTASIVGFSALGDNLRFENDLAAFQLVEFHGFGDHHAFTEADLQQLNRRRIQKNAKYLVCTEKDFIKIKHYNLTQIPLIYAKNSIKFNFDLLGCVLNHVEEKDKI